MNILLDLDGTLTDPRSGIVSSIVYALEQLDVAVPPEDQLLKYIGPPLHEAFEELLQTVDRSRIDFAVAKYRERYSDTGIINASVYPGIHEALRILRARGMRLLVATSKPWVFAERVISHFELSGYIDTIWGSELDGARANKEELIAHILAQTRIDPSTTLMVGDRKHDVVGARSNGVRAIGVLWGYGSEDELTAAGCTVLLNSTTQLAELVIQQ